MDAAACKGISLAVRTLPVRTGYRIPIEGQQSYGRVPTSGVVSLKKLSYSDDGEGLDKEMSRLPSQESTGQYCERSRATGTERAICRVMQELYRNFWAWWGN